MLKYVLRLFSENRVTIFILELTCSHGEGGEGFAALLDQIVALPKNVNFFIK